jgi:hypothetical protein
MSKKIKKSNQKVSNKLVKKSKQWILNKKAKQRKSVTFGYSIYVLRDNKYGKIRNLQEEEGRI